MKLVLLLPVFVIVFIAGCIGQTEAPASTGAPEQPGPGVMEPALEPLPPPSSQGIGFVLVSPQPGQHIFNDEINIVLAPVNFTVVPPGTEVREKEGYFVLTFNSRLPVSLYSGGPGYQHTFTDVQPGNHTVKVEVVSADGKPLTPPLVRIIVFTAGSKAPPGPSGCRYDNPSCPADYKCIDEENICVPR